MQHQEVETLAIGAGPANLALAIALEELAPAECAADTLIVEQHDDIVWQRGMLLPWTQSQVSFLKDLVTLRNPRSRFSFVNFLHDTGRLDEFINLGSFTPYRLEISAYLAWVDRSLEKVRTEFGLRCTGVDPVEDDHGTVTHWRAHFAGGRTIRCRNLVLGAGRDPHVPAEFAVLPPERIVHSTEFSLRIDDFPADRVHRVTVVGGAQSAAEMLVAAHQRFPEADCTMVMRSIGLNCYESSKFTNELYYPSFIDEFHSARPEAREQLLREMHRTNYSGLAPATLDALYRERYLGRLVGRDRLHMVTMSEVADARMVGDLAAGLGMGDVTVNRRYRMNVPPKVTAGCYLQGVNEATHGIADSLLSVLAKRAEEIVFDLLARRGPETRTDTDTAVPAAVLASR